MVSTANIHRLSDTIGIYLALPRLIAWCTAHSFQPSFVTALFDPHCNNIVNWG